LRFTIYDLRFQNKRGNGKSNKNIETGMSLESLRLFAAITIPEPVRNEMLAVQRELKPLALGDVRWAKPEQLHLTLKFLGNVPVISLEAVKKSLTIACAGAGPFHLNAKGIGFFPNERQPRVIWVGIEDDENALVRLQQRIERSLAPFAEKKGAEQFRPHATLGRFQKYRRYKTEQLVPHASSFGIHVFGGWRVEEVGLLRSELSQAGARHMLMSSHPLAVR
jgi:2'-5' RNA ligase